MKQIIKGIKITSILFLTFTFFVGCVDDDDNQLPTLEAAFTHTINQDTGTVRFINTSMNANTYSWDFGDGTASTEINPINTYEAGTYTVVLQSDNIAGASDTFEDTIVIGNSGGGGGGSCTAETTESIAAADLNITFQTNTPAVIEDNTTFSWIDNPDSEGAVNTSCKVGQVVRANNSPFDNLQIDLTDKLDFSISDGLKIKVWSPVANTPVLIKLEEVGNAGNFVEITQTTADANTWTELTYDFESTATPQFDKMVIFFNFNVADGSTYYFDDLMVYGTGGGGGGTCTAETTESVAAADLNISFLSNTPAIIEDNATFSWIDNPDSDGTVNTSCKVGEVVRANNSPFDNVQIDLADKLDFNASEGIKMKVWSPVANTPVLLKLEEIGNAGNFVEILQTTGAANTWTELTYDFASTAAPQFNKMVIFFNFNVADGSTYYFDDVMVYGAGGGGGGTCVPETTESSAASDLNITFQTNTPAVIEDNTAFSWIDNPDFDGTVNTSCKVGQVDRFNNSPFDNVQIDLANKLDFNTSDGLKMKVWSPIANTPVLLKLEEIGNSGNFVEILQTTGAANTWTELTYDFASTATPQFNKLVVFFNFNVADGSTYYFDDLALYGTGGGGGGGGGTYSLDETIDFEPAGFGAAWTWNVFENGSNPPLEFIANPVSGGINTSATVAKITALQAGQPYVGTETAHGEMGITWDLDASNAIIKIMVYKTVISDVGIKLVNPNGGAQEEIKVSNTVINQWEELTFDFTSRIGNGLDGSTNIDQIVVFPDFATRTSDNVVYFDNITFQ